MKVLHVVASLAPRHGGPTEAALAMVRAQRRRGAEAAILSSNDDLGGFLHVPTNEWTRHEDVPVWFVPRIRSKQHSLVGFTLAPGFIPWLRRHAREYDFIHVHTVFSFPANCAMSAARHRGIPYAARPLGQLCEWSLRQSAIVKKLMLRLVARRNLDHAAFIHCTTRMEAAETERVGLRSPMLVVPHGLEPPPAIKDARQTLRAQLGVPPEKLLVAFMSRIHEKKGIELLVDACASLKDPAFDLVLAGTGEESYVNALRRRVKDAGLSSRVHWPGFVSGDEKWRVLQGADLFVLPSHSENFGIAVLEALACGLPVVVSTEVALQDEITARRLGLTTALDAGAVAEAMRAMLTDPAARHRIRSEAPDWVTQNYSWDRAADRLIGAYEQARSARKEVLQ